jgi:hypothetical protein
VLSGLYITQAKTATTLAAAVSAATEAGEVAAVEKIDFIELLVRDINRVLLNVLFVMDDARSRVQGQTAMRQAPLNPLCIKPQGIFFIDFQNNAKSTI